MSGAYVYATDEDVAIKAPADWPLVVPRDQALFRTAAGSFDGVDGWTVRLATPDPSLSAVGPGNVVLVTDPKSAFRVPGELFGVESSGPASLTFRRRGLGTREGAAPYAGPPLTAVAFEVRTVRPQLVSAGAEIDRRYGVDDIINGRRHCDLWDPAELAELVVLRTLAGLYLAASRGTSDPTLSGGASGRPDVWSAKRSAVMAELEALESRAAVRWRDTTGVPTGPTSAFNLRITR